MRSNRRGQVLSILGNGAREMSGVEVADAIGGFARSSAYSALASLQRDGLVRARWEVDADLRNRRLFALTETGLDLLHREWVAEKKV